MKELEQIFFCNRTSFRKWLEYNHDKNSGIWMLFYKKHPEISAIKYNEALEEALCYGWIDSIIKKVDEERYVRKFTPRKDVFKWSELNKNIVNQLIEKGMMTNAGLEKIDSYRKTGTVKWSEDKTEPTKNRKTEIETPDFILRELAKNEPALNNFNNLTPACRKQYILWISSASMEVTIKKRLKESISLLKANRKLGLK